MKRTWEYLRNEQGETLVESIVAFLVIAIVMVAFAAMATSGANLSAEAHQNDANLGAAMAPTGAATATISGSEGNVSVPVNTTENTLVKAYEM